MVYVTIAEESELALVKELGYNRYPIIITGCGGANVIKSLRELPKDSVILNIGYCGSKKIKVGTKVLINEVETLHENAQLTDIEFCKDYLDFDIKKSRVAKCYTSTDFVTETSKKEKCVFDMEFAFIRAMFPKAVGIKVVSDNLNKEMYNSKVGGVQ